jgi:hypothetical protein
VNEAANMADTSLVHEAVSSLIASYNGGDATVALTSLAQIKGMYTNPECLDILDEAGYAKHVLSVSTYGEW